MHPTAGSTRALAAVTVATLITALVVLVPSSPAAAVTPTPVTTLSVPDDPFIGDTISVQVGFFNAATTAVGYGPYVDLFTESTGADGNDGVSFASATYLGQPVTTQTRVLACNGTDTHPLTGRTFTCPAGIAAGDTVTVLTLPFGSFAPSQPALDLSVSLQISQLADLGRPLVVATRGGFRFGADALDNPLSDPPLVQPAATSTTVSPTVLSLDKVDDAPESETATGENFRRTWTVTARVAPGQTVTNLVLTDRLAPTVAYGGLDALSAGGSVVAEPPSSQPQVVPDNVVAAQWSTVSTDVAMAVGFWVPQLDAFGDPVLGSTSGAAVTVPNDASVTANWDPLDPRDPVTPVTVDPVGAEDQLTARSLATQKSVQLVADVGATGASPGDTLEWTIQVQVSDHFTFDQVELADVLSDGQSIDPTFVPTLSVSTPGGSGPVPGFDGHVTSTVDGCAAPVPGAVRWDADLTAALDGQFPATGGRFVGGEGVGPTTATVRLRTVIDADYRCPAGAPSVNSGDSISNDVTIAGTVIDGGVTGSRVTDTSAAGVTIVEPDLSKVVYAVNGDTGASVAQIAPGDVVTYRLRSSLPITNVFDTSLTDFLPLPTFDLPGGGLSTDFVAPQAPGSFTPVPWSIRRGPDDTFTGASGVTGADPVLAVDQQNNSFTLAYPDYQAAPGDSAAVIDLLVNVVASEQRFADGLFLTNQVDLTFSDSRSVTSSEAAIVQVQLTEPRLQISKGVVRTDRSGVTFAPSQVGPAGVTWSAPGTSGARFSGAPITSAGLQANGVGSSLSGVDAGDVVTFALVVENVGSGLNGAFDVEIADVLPAGFVEPVGGWNLSVTDGTGAPIGFSTSAGPGPLGASITLDDDPGAGSLAAFSSGSGTNLAVVTFDARLGAGAAFSASSTNTASVPGYSATDGGPNFVTTPLQDTAGVTTTNPDVAKVIASTQMVPGVTDTPSRTTLAIGSLVTFDVTMTVPEGSAAAVTLVDTLAAGLAVVSVDSISASPALSTSRPGGFPAVLAGATVSSVGTGTTAPGRRVTFDFATLANSNDDNATIETVTVRLTAVVLNVAANTPTTATTRNNAAQVFVGAAAVSPSRVSPSVTIVGPRLTTTKSANVAAADAGDTVTYTLTVSAVSTPRVSDAHDVVLSDVLPSGVTLVPGSFVHTGGVAPTSIDGSASPLSASWAVLQPGQTSTLRYSVVVDDNASSFGPTAVNTAAAEWTTQPGDPGSQSTFNTLGVQRTGSSADVGGSANNLRSTDSASVTVNQATITKTLEATSATHTTGSNVTIGERVSYSLNVELPEGDLGQVVVTDLLPTGLVADLASVAVDSSALSGSLGTVSSQIVGNNVVVTFGSVSVTATPDTTDNVVVVTLDAVVADVPANTSGDVLNNRGRVAIGGTQFNSALVPVTLVVPALTVTKSVAPLAAAVNDEVTYTFSVTNSGSSSVFDVVLSDLVDGDVLVDVTDVVGPAGWTPSVSAEAGGTSVRWTSPAGLAPAASASFSFDAVVAETISFPGSHVNTAQASGSSLPGSPAGSRSVTDGDDAGLVFSAVDIAVQKAAAVPAAAAGDPIEYVIAVSNQGTRDATGVTLVDSLGEHVEFVAASGGGTHDAGEVTWPAFDLAVGTTREFTVTVDVVSPLPVGAVATTNTARADDDGTHGPDAIPSDNSDTVTVTLDAEVDLSVAKAATEADVAPGGSLSYRVTVDNLGDSEAEGASVVDTLGANLEFVSASGGGVWDPTDRTITWSDVDLFGEADAVFDVVARVIDAVPAGTDEVTNSVRVSHPDDVNPTNDDAEVSTPVLAAPDLTITKSNSSSTMLAGQPVTYELEVRNVGDRGAAGVTVVDTLPAEVAFVSASDGGVHDPDGGTVTWDLGVMEPNAGRDLSVTVTALDPLPPGTVSVANTVEVADDGLNGDDPNPEDNTATDTDRTGADLVVTKRLDADALTPGSPATYSISVTNDGPETVTEMTVDDTLPTGLVLPEFAPSEGSFDPVTLRWSDVSLAPGETVVMEVTVDVELTVTDELTNVVTVTPIGPADPTPDDATAETTDAAVAVVDVRLSKVLDTALARGELATYSLAVLNSGPSNATDVVVRDQLPPALAFESFSGEGWTCELTRSGPVDGSEVTCRLDGFLPPGAESSFSLDARVAPDVEGEIENTATASFAEEDAGGSTLVASASGEVPPLPPPPTAPDDDVPTAPGPVPVPAPAPAPAGGAAARSLALTGAAPWALVLLGLALMAAGMGLHRRRR